jgi:GntR family transcriptional regulator, phosphonate transport system regulatory protein
MTATAAKLARPVYRRIADALRDDIESSLQPGDRLLPEHQLAGRFQVNRHTVRRAVDLLAEAGLLVRKQGTGTFVTEAPIDYAIGGRTRFTENLAGHRPVNRILRRRVMEATGGVCERLQLEEGAQVIHLESLRLVDDKPLCVTSQFLPLTAMRLVLSEYDGGSLHEFIGTHYGISPRRTYSLVTATLPFPADATALMMPVNQPVLRVKSVNVDPRDGAPLEYSVARFRADRLQLRFDLEHQPLFKQEK